jgi:hypothetical protein
MKRTRPTFELLREACELTLVNPDNGVRFRVSLRHWENVLWAIRIYPFKPRRSDRDNMFCTGHRMVSRAFIEEWLAHLRLALN